MDSSVHPSVYPSKPMYGPLVLPFEIVRFANTPKSQIEMFNHQQEQADHHKSTLQL